MFSTNYHHPHWGRRDSRGLGLLASYTLIIYLSLPLSQQQPPALPAAWEESSTDTAPPRPPALLSAARFA